MPLFAFIYHPTRALTPEELARRSQVVRHWTLEQLRAGRFHSVAVFDDAVQLVGELQRPGPPSAGVALVEAADWTEARALATVFPGRAFGTAVEVRQVKTHVAGNAP